jgi:predicted extracellular nuclease
MPDRACARHETVKRRCEHPARADNPASDGEIMFATFVRGSLGIVLLAAASASSAQVVISQVYGGGGNSGATYKNDFIELFNAGSTTVDLSTWSVQYNSASGTSIWQVTPLTGSIAPGHYYLVKEAAGTGGTTDLPTPDATGAIAMGAGGGRIALVTSQTAFPAQTPSGCPADTSGIIDLVGVAGSSCFEGTAGAPAPSNTTAQLRAGSGCTDSDDNAADFTTAAPAPRNAATAAHLCGTVLSVNSVTLDEGNAGTTDFVFTVSLSSPAPAAGVTFDITTTDGTATTADGDYAANSATGVTIAEGESEYQFTVHVNGDTNSEPDEQFTVDVSNISGTGVVSTSAQGTGTITNDDAAPLSIDITGVSKPEGNSGTTDFVFSVTLSAPAPAGGVTFDIATSDVTATSASGDYVAKQLTAQSFAEGEDTYEFTVQVNGDTKFEADETFHVDVTNISGTNVDPTAQHGTGTITNDDTATIGDIQGNGLVSPYANQAMATTGVVTAVGGSSFAMQDAPEVADGDADTSDGIIVFTGSTPAVQVGDVVSVSGTVQEFNGQTEISGSPVVLVTGVHDPIAPIVLDTTLPSPNPLVHLCAGTLPTTNADAGNWECLEGMLVQIDGVVVGATNGGGGADGTHAGTPGFFYATVGDAPRPFREAGVEYPGLQDPLHPDVPVFDGDPEIIEFYPPGAIGGPNSLVVNAGQHFSSTSIVGDFKGTYELYPSTWSLTGDTPDTVQPVPASAAGTLTIASQNMLHFFNDVHDSGSIDGCTPGTADTCETTAQFTVRRQKLSRQIRDVLGAPAVVGVQEVENLATLQALADQIHFDDPSLTYTAYLSEGNDVGGIDVGVLVRNDVSVNGVTQLGKSTLTTGDACNNDPCPKLNDRPPLLLDATFNGYHFAVLVIHNRSLNDADTARVQAKRLQQAQYVAEIMQAWQTGSSTPLSDGDVVPNPDADAPIVVIGDYNAYEFTDGYVDVTGQIKGVVDADENKLSATPITSPTLCDAGLTTAAETRYSFQFDGYVQELDHSLLSRIGWRDFISLANAHGNADTSEAGPEVTDPTTPARSADHDGQVLTLAPDRILADDNEGDTCH